MNFVQKSEQILWKSALFLLVMAVPGLVWASSQEISKGCNGREASRQLFLMITGLDLNTGVVNVNGGDYRRPIATPFTWNWGDGSITQGWFPQSHVYANTTHDYMLQVTSHEDDGLTDCARILIPIYKSRIPENSPGGGFAVNEINVPGSQPWTDTGIEIRAGDLVSINATGGIRFSVNGPFGGPDGDGPDCHHLGVEIRRWTFPDADLSCHSLIGRIGLSGPIFEVGSSGRFRTPVDGRLYLGVNDNFFPDNSGNWTAEISLGFGDSPRSNSGKSQPSTTDSLGTTWNERELGWEGVWRRRGTSNIFDATWNDGEVTAVLTISLQGTDVKVERRNSSNNCDYQGTLAADSVTVSGTYSCDKWARNSPWRATIQNANPISTLGSWWGFANGNVAQDRDAELRSNCGDFKRVYVPDNAGNKFTDLCGYMRKTCEKVCDWEGRTLPCGAVSLGGNRDGTRVAVCR